MDQASPPPASHSLLSSLYTTAVPSASVPSPCAFDDPSEARHFALVQLELRRIRALNQQLQLRQQARAVVPASPPSMTRSRRGGRGRGRSDGQPAAPHLSSAAVQPSTSAPSSLRPSSSSTAPVHIPSTYLSPSSSSSSSSRPTPAVASDRAWWPSASSSSSSSPTPNPTADLPNPPLPHLSYPPSHPHSHAHLHLPGVSLFTPSPTSFSPNALLYHLTNLPYAATVAEVRAFASTTGLRVGKVVRLGRGDEAVVEVLDSPAQPDTWVGGGARLGGRVVGSTAVALADAQRMVREDEERRSRKMVRTKGKEKAAGGGRAGGAGGGAEGGEEKDGEAALRRAYDDAFTAVYSRAPSSVLLPLLSFPRVNLAFVIPGPHFFDRNASHAVSAFPSFYPHPTSAATELRAESTRGQDRSSPFLPFHTWGFAAHTLLHALVVTDRTDLLASLLTPANVDTIDSRQHPLLAYAIGMQASAATVQLLLDKKADVLKADAAQLTPLHLACTCASPHLSLLLSAAAPGAVNVMDRYRLTPLHLTAKQGWTEGLRLLLAAGAQSSYDVWGHLPVFYAAEAFKSEYHKRVLSEKTALHRAQAKDEQAKRGQGSSSEASREAPAAVRGGRGRGGGGSSGRGGSSRTSVRTDPAAPSASNASSPSVWSVPIPSFAIGRLMGVRGKHIRELQERTGTHMRVEAAGSDPASSRLLIIKGTDEQVQAARTLVLELVQERSSGNRHSDPVKEPTQKTHTTQSSSPSSSTASNSKAAPPAPLPSAQSLIDNICLLASDQLASLQTLFEQAPHPLVHSALISHFTPAAIVLHIQHNSGPNTSYYRNDSNIVTALAKAYQANPAPFFSSSTTFPALLCILASEVDKRTVTAWATALTHRPPPPPHLLSSVSLLARTIRIASRIALFSHPSGVDRAPQEFVDHFFPVLLLWWEAAGRPDEEGFVRDFQLLWDLLDSALMDVERDEESIDRFAVFLHAFFQFTQTFPQLTFTWKDDNGRLREEEKDVKEKESTAADDKGLEEVEADESRRRRIMQTFLTHHWLTDRRRRGKRGGKRATGGDDDFATVLQWTEEAKAEEGAKASPVSDTREEVTSLDDGEEEKSEKKEAADDAWLPLPYLTANPSQPPHRRAHPSNATSFPSARGKGRQPGPALLSLLTRPLSPAFRTFLLDRHHSALLHLLSLGDQSFHRYLYFLLAMPGTVGLDLRLRCLRSAVEGRWGDVGEEVVIAVNRLGIDKWDSEGSDDDEEEDDEEDDDEGHPHGDESEYSDDVYDDFYPNNRRSASRPNPTPTTTAPTPSSSTPASSNATPAPTVSAPTPVETLEFLMQQVLSASPQSLATNVVARFVGERGVGDGPIRELLALATSQLFSPTSPYFSLNPNRSAYHLKPSASSNSPSSLRYFEFTGRILALCILHAVPVGVSVSHSLLSLVCGGRATLTELKEFDADIYRSCLHLIHRFSTQEERDRAAPPGSSPEADDDDAAPLFFTCDVALDGQSSEVELLPNGASTRVQASSLSLFLRLFTSQRIFGPLAPAADAFARGFNSLIPRSLLALLSPSELHSLLLGQPPSTSLSHLRRLVTYHDGLHGDSQVVTWFWDWVEGLGEEGRKRLWSFWGGLEVLGWGAMGGPGAGEGWHIERGEDDGDVGWRAAGGRRRDVDPLRLPSSSTCTYTLRLPMYSSKEQLQRAMTLALDYGSKGFGEA